MRQPRVARQFATVLGSAAAIAGGEDAHARGGNPQNDPDLPNVQAAKGSPVLPEIWDGRLAAAASAKRPANPAREVRLTIPLRDGLTELSDVVVHVASDGKVSLDPTQVVAALRPALMPSIADRLAANLTGRKLMPVSDFAEIGVPILFDPTQLSLKAVIAPSDRAIRNLTAAETNRAPAGDFDQPARFSGYINARANADYKWIGASRGITSSRVQLDAAVRVGPVVLESDGELAIDLAGNARTSFRRDGTRLVYDWRAINARITAGDLLPTSRGFSGTSQIAGIGIQRSYSVLQPQRNIQPNGSRSFTLTQTSTVEAIVNGSMSRRFRLDPGNYNLQDLPFSQGLNNVQLLITNDSGQRETIDFSTYFDRSLLEPGLMEFGLFGGVNAPRSVGGRSYRTDEPVASGHARLGITSGLTAGANFHARKEGAVGGVEAVVVTPLGPIGFDLAASVNKGFGTGFALNTGFQRPIGRRRKRGSILALNIEARSRRFSTPGPFLVDEPIAYNIGLSYSQRLAGSQVLSFDGRYSKGRTIGDVWSARAIYSRQLAQNASFLGEALYERRFDGRTGVGVRLGISVRPTARSTVTADYNSNSGFSRLSYATSGGDGVGTYFLNADAEYAANSLAMSGGAGLIANRAELGIAHTASFAVSGNGIADERTSLRFATALVMAEGHFALSRPVFDSFALVHRHETLNGAKIIANPRASGHTGNSGLFGGAVVPGLASYVEQSLAFTVPEAPPGYDLGSGSARVMPSYKSGYLITAGSDYMITALGTLLDRDGQPVALLAGEAQELAQPTAKPIAVFTNRSGRFGIQGLRPGKWRITMPTTPPSEVEIDIPAAPEDALANLGTVQLKRAMPRPAWGD